MLNRPPRVVWCLGMYASGSTWTFNMAREVARQLHPGEQAEGVFAESLWQVLRLPAGMTMVKTHHLPRPAAALLGARAGLILLTLRDPRDAVTSLMQHMGRDFSRALREAEASAQFCARYAADPRSLVLRYEDGFIDTPETIDRLAERLGGALPIAARDDLFAQSRREAIEAKISKLAASPTATRSPKTPADLMDLDTQWHLHHAGRTGESGRWRRMLQPEAVSKVERQLGGFMRRFGYLG
ncbi:hypothetical protein [Acidocella sp. KAb 2-4]|uniref:hypothetical protein n=1 Tax=Acidocella sp. KAb 2-4 TaxID=2885158 RepID=UPI001D0784C3|nr:hypothetical protein [Acidocella sp. KAb 2-4]MCB5943431.1 hypothetical protein [Acidocella sp. KAb 2-4]